MTSLCPSLETSQRGARVGDIYMALIVAAVCDPARLRDVFVSALETTVRGLTAEEIQQLGQRLGA